MPQQQNKSKRNNSKKELMELLSAKLKEAIANTQVTQKCLQGTLLKLKAK